MRDAPNTSAAPIPPPPWHSRVDALLWWHRATPAARALIPAPLRRGPVPITVGGLIAYHAGPVGPYRELFAAVLVRHRRTPVAHVPFIAVDSAASVAGGRRNWALPKVLARFGRERGGPGVVVSAHDWEVALRGDVRRRALPLSAALPCAQVWPDGGVGRFTVWMGGRAQLATAHVQPAAGQDLGPWLLAGRHDAIRVAGTQTVEPPAGHRAARPERAPSSV
jgi:hypothetical protein